jgi:hypothetical protein
VPREVARDFLARTERVVPSGEESSEQVIDSLLVRLLGAQPPRP